MSKGTIQDLRDKTMKVILSCKTLDQLKYAIDYQSLAYKRLAPNCNSEVRYNFVQLTERCIGFAHARITS